MGLHLLCNPDWPRIYFVDQAGSEHVILLHLLPRWQYYRQSVLCLAYIILKQMAEVKNVRELVEEGLLSLQQ